jgi:hypothetical protein
MLSAVTGLILATSGRLFRDTPTEASYGRNLAYQLVCIGPTGAQEAKCRWVADRSSHLAQEGDIRESRKALEIGTRFGHC